MMKKSVPLYLISLFMVAGLLLGACQPAAPVAPTAPAAPTTAPAVEQPTQAPVVEQPTTAPATQAPAANEDVTLRVWNQETADGPYSLKMDEVTKKFEETHPGVKVEVTHYTMEDLDKSVPLAMNQPDGPDISQVNNGYSVMGTLVKAGLLTDLTPYAAKFGWDKLVSQGLRARMSFTPDAKEFGTGNLYGMAMSAEIVGVYYNRKLFADNNVSVPKTLEEFEADLKLFKDKGIVPLGMSCGGDGVTCVQTPQAVLHLTADPKWLFDYAFGRPNVSYNTPEVVKSAETIMKWMKAGYFTPDYAGIDDQQLVSLFAQGQSAMLVGGNWWSAQLVEAVPNGFGFFVLPAAEGKPAPMSIGGLGYPFAISAHSKHQDLAAEYLDALFSQEAADLYASVGQLPARGISDAQKGKVDSLLADIIAAFTSQNTNDRIGQYLDWAGPNMWTASKAATQELLAGRVTPAQYAEEIEKQHALDLAARAQ
jgi:raffinose/stachyose/melibiose transport system substrate-binding protein